MSEDILSEEQVAKFLRSHPDFFATHPELLADLKIPHENGSAVSLVERQVSVLRERNVELRERLNGLLSIARDNDVIFEKTRALVLTLLEAQDLAAATQALSQSLLDDFGMAAMSVILFDAGVEAPPPRVQLVDAAAAESRMGGLLKGRRVVCGVLRPEELAWAFGSAADAVGSAAIVPLVFHGNLGLLAIGARDPQHFKSGMDTLFVGHIGDVLARRLHVLLPARDRQDHARSGR
ncbi:MAG: DUF484 family protein [Pseudomonadota bacterium]